MSLASLIMLMLARALFVIRSIQKSRYRRSSFQRNGAPKSSNATKSDPPTTIEKLSARPANSMGGTDLTNETANGQSSTKIKTMVVLGSGGHTTEMIYLLQELDPSRYSPVVYVLADSDATSLPRLKNHIIAMNGKNEGCRWKGRFPVDDLTSGRNSPPRTQTQTNSLAGTNKEHEINALRSTEAEVYRLPRPREVHQSYVSSIFTSLRSFFRTLLLVWEVTPDLVLANGPGTCVPIVYSIFLFRLLGSPGPSRLSKLSKCKVVFIESLCRVQTLSLSGKLVYPIVDHFIVHWPKLRERHSSVEVCDVFVNHDRDHGLEDYDGGETRSVGRRIDTDDIMLPTKQKHDSSSQTVMISEMEKNE